MELKKYKLGEVADIQTGPFGSQLHNEDYVKVGIPIVTVEHLGERNFSTQNLPMVSTYDADRLKKYSLKPGDIVFSRVGAVDRCSLVEGAQDGWLFSGRCLRVRPYNGIDSSFLYYYLNTESFKSYIRNVAVGCTMPSLNTSILEEIPVWLPDYKEQHNMGIILEAIDRKIALNREINRDLLNLFLNALILLRDCICHMNCELLYGKYGAKVNASVVFAFVQKSLKNDYVIGVGSGAGLWSG